MKLGTSMQRILALCLGILVNFRVTLTETVECRCEYPNENYYNPYNWRHRDLILVQEDFVQINGEYILPSYHPSCRMIHYICPGEVAHYPLWNEQCDTPLMKKKLKDGPSGKTVKVKDTKHAKSDNKLKENFRPKQKNFEDLKKRRTLNVSSREKQRRLKGSKGTTYSKRTVLLPENNPKCAVVTSAPSSIPTSPPINNQAIIQAPTLLPSVLSKVPTSMPIDNIVDVASDYPSDIPSDQPSSIPTEEVRSDSPSASPISHNDSTNRNIFNDNPVPFSSPVATKTPTLLPSLIPTSVPVNIGRQLSPLPSSYTSTPSDGPSSQSQVPTPKPSGDASLSPSATPTSMPPSIRPSYDASISPSILPTASIIPSEIPSPVATTSPSKSISTAPISVPAMAEAKKHDIFSRRTLLRGRQ